MPLDLNLVDFELESPFEGSIFSTPIVTGILSSERGYNQHPSWNLCPQLEALASHALHVIEHLKEAVVFSTRKETKHFSSIFAYAGLPQGLFTSTSSQVLVTRVKRLWHNYSSVDKEFSIVLRGGNLLDIFGLRNVSHEVSCNLASNIMISPCLPGFPIEHPFPCSSNKRFFS